MLRSSYSVAFVMLEHLSKEIIVQRPGCSDARQYVCPLTIPSSSFLAATLFLYHSCLKACIGSTAAAQRAGTQLATSPINASSKADVANIRGSFGCKP
jgi:hypothetical protein